MCVNINIVYLEFILLRIKRLNENDHSISLCIKYDTKLDIFITF